MTAREIVAPAMQMELGSAAIRLAIVNHARVVKLVKRSALMYAAQSGQHDKDGKGELGYGVVRACEQLRSNTEVDGCVVL